MTASPPLVSCNAMLGRAIVKRLRFACCGEDYLLGSYRIATAPEPNSSWLTSFKSIRFESHRELHATREQSLTRLPLELLNGLPQIPAHQLCVPIDPVQGPRHDVLLFCVDRPGEGLHPIRSCSRPRRRPPPSLHHFVSRPAKEDGISPIEGLNRADADRKSTTLKS